MFRSPCLHFETVIVIALPEGFHQVGPKEANEAVFIELADMGQLMPQPPAVPVQFFNGSIVQMDGPAQYHGHFLGAQPVGCKPGEDRILSYRIFHLLKLRKAGYFARLALPVLKTLDRLNPNLISPLSHLPVVSVMKARSFIPVELEKCNWKTCPPVSISTPTDKGLV